MVCKSKADHQQVSWGRPRIVSWNEPSILLQDIGTEHLNQKERDEALAEYERTLNYENGVVTLETQPQFESSNNSEQVVNSVQHARGHGSLACERIHY